VVSLDALLDFKLPLTRRDFADVPPPPVPGLDSGEPRDPELGSGEPRDPGGPCSGDKLLDSEGSLILGNFAWISPRWDIGLGSGGLDLGEFALRVGMVFGDFCGEVRVGESELGRLVRLREEEATRIINFFFVVFFGIFGETEGLGEDFFLDFLRSFLGDFGAEDDLERSLFSAEAAAFALKSDDFFRFFSLTS